MQFPNSLVEELIELQDQGFKEVFDDSATFPDGKWLMEFCIKKINSDVRYLPFSCNMRIDGECDFKIMKDAGFRMLLFGVESANQHTF